MESKGLFFITLIGCLCLCSPASANFEEWLRGQITPVCGDSEAKFVRNYVLAMEHLYIQQAFFNNKADRIPVRVREITSNNVFMAPSFRTALGAAETQVLNAHRTIITQGNDSINKSVEAAHEKVFIDAHSFIDDVVWEPGKILVERSVTDLERAFECSAVIIPDFTKFIQDSFKLGIQCANNFFVDYNAAFTQLKRADIRLTNSNFYVQRCTNRPFAEIAGCLNQLTPVVPSTANGISEDIQRGGTAMVDENARQIGIFLNCMTEAANTINSKMATLSADISTCVNA